MDSIVDSTSLLGTDQWNSMPSILRASVKQYRSDWWKDQDYYIEIWLEKEALAGIFKPVTDPYGVFLSVAGGYPTLSQVYSGKLRLEQYEDKPKIILYFGDLDPSGKDMPRSLRNTLRFLNVKDTEVIEVALTKDDVLNYKLTRNPLKFKDTRKKGFIEKYGINYAVELDALEPQILRDKISKSIESHINIDILNECKSRDLADKDKWNKIIERVV